MKTKPFNLEEAKAGAKVVTRSGHNVRILCYDQRGCMPIVALVEFETLDGVQMFYSDGKNESHREYDLFLVSEEEELTEFEYAVLAVISDHNNHKDSIEEFAKRNANKLLDLARKELQPEIDHDLHLAFKTQDEVVYQRGYKQGREDTLKDLPKWKAMCLP